MMERIVLAYSGGFDTSVAIPWLAGKYGAEIVAVTMDLGQGPELEAVRDRALAAGAVRAHVLDVREEFARDHVLRALTAGAIADDGDPIGTALALPLIARKLVEIAAIEQASVIAHGGTGNSRGRTRLNVRGRLEVHERLDLMARALNPAITVLAPVREWDMTRPEEVEYAKTRGIPVTAADTSFSVEANLWGRSIEPPVADGRWPDPPAAIYTMTRPPEECPAETALVEIAFERGVPTAINGVGMPLLELIASLGTIAGAHGVGRGVSYEAPAAVVLHTAHRELQRVVSTPDAEGFSRLVSLQYTDIVYNGQWFTPLREALDAYVDKIQERVSGLVRLELSKGDCRIASCTSPFAVADLAQATSDAGDAFKQRATSGLLEIVGLPSKTAARKA